MAVCPLKMLAVEYHESNNISVTSHKCNVIMSTACEASVMVP